MGSPPPPPLFGQCTKENVFLLLMSSLSKQFQAIQNFEACELVFHLNEMNAFNRIVCLLFVRHLNFWVVVFSVNQNIEYLNYLVAGQALGQIRFPGMMTSNGHALYLYWKIFVLENTCTEKYTCTCTCAVTVNDYLQKVWSQV